MGVKPMEQTTGTLPPTPAASAWPTLTAEEAREYGIVDRVVERLEDVRPGGDRPAGL